MESIKSAELAIHRLIQNLGLEGDYEIADYLREALIRSLQASQHLSEEQKNILLSTVSTKNFEQ